MKNRTITIDEYDACHLYELALEHFDEHCVVCENIRDTLENFIGDKESERIQRAVKRNSYCRHNAKGNDTQ